MASSVVAQALQLEDEPFLGHLCQLSSEHGQLLSASGMVLWCMQ